MRMQPFATVADYRATYDTDASDERLAAFLARASRRIAVELVTSGIDISSADEVYEGLLSDVAISMTHRAIGDVGLGADVPFGATELSETNDFANASVKFANPYGDFFLTSDEREALGLGAGRAVVISPYG